MKRCKLSDLIPENDFEHLKWATERQFRERELVLKEQEVSIQREEQSRSRWRSPLVVAILAAAAAALGNALVAFLNGQQSELLEDTRAESARILEMIKTGDADHAAENLRFLVDAGLIENPVRLAAIQRYLQSRAPGGGPSLPPPSASQDKTGDSLALFRKAIALNPNDVDGYRRLAGGLVDQGRLAEAVALLQKSVALAPKDPVGHIDLGSVYVALGRMDEAVSEFRYAMTLDPTNVTAVLDLGGLLAQLGHLDDSAMILRRAIELDPKSAVAHRTLSTVLRSQGHIPEADAESRAADAIESHPSQAPAP